MERSYADRRDVMKLQIGRVKVSYTDLSAGTRFLEAPICGMVPVHSTPWRAILPKTKVGLWNFGLEFL